MFTYMCAVCVGGRLYPLSIDGRNIEKKDHLKNFFNIGIVAHKTSIKQKKKLLVELCVLLYKKILPTCVIQLGLFFV